MSVLLTSKSEELVISGYVKLDVLEDIIEATNGKSPLVANGYKLKSYLAFRIINKIIGIIRRRL